MFTVLRLSLSLSHTQKFCLYQFILCLYEKYKRYFPEHRLSNKRLPEFDDTPNCGDSLIHTLIRTIDVSKRSVQLSSTSAIARVFTTRP